MLCSATSASPNTHMSDSKWLSDQKRQIPPAASLAVSLLEICIKSQLTEAEFTKAIAVGREATQRITTACQQRNNTQAVALSQHYLNTKEGQIALACVTKLKPMLDQPEIQTALGKHRNDVLTVLQGKVPTKVCY